MSGFLEKAAAAVNSNIVGWKTRYPEPLEEPGHTAPEFLPSGSGGCTVIAEVKMKSPSRGDLMGEKDPPCLSLAYENAGAGAVSVVVEEQYFGGSPELFVDVAEVSALPLLWKDFVIDPYQIHLAAALGAAAILVIAAMLTDADMSSFINTTRKAGLRPLVEVHNEIELRRAVDAGADLVGVNNRDLTTLTVDTAVSERLADKVPADVQAVSESGIRTPADVEFMASLGYSGVLIGESLVTCRDTEQLLGEMVEAGKASIGVSG